MLDPKKLENYLLLQAGYGNSSLIPKGAADIRVQNIKKLSGGVANNVYAFSMRFNEGTQERNLKLILKGYSDQVSPWFRISRPGEELRKYIREYDTLTALQKIGFPASKAYLCEVDSFFLGYPFLVMRQEKAVKNGLDGLDYFAATLATLHNLEVESLGIKSLNSPKGDSEFANNRLLCLKKYLVETKHYGFLRKNFDLAISWLESNVENNSCPKYRLIHGEYHPGHTLLTDENIMTVIDWESVAIGDPAFDVGYAYQMVKLMCNRKDLNLGERVANQFLLDYVKNSNNDIKARLEFYKIVGILGVAVAVSSWISNPMRTYKLFGRKSLLRAMAFPIFRSPMTGKRWLDDDFLVYCLHYCQDFIKTTLN